MKNAMAMDNKEQRIRETAYRLWEEDGRPHGQADRHWNIAQKLAGDDEPRQPAPAARPTREANGKKAPVARKRLAAR
jgi:Protein of unknown function (DUF2934)